MPLADTPAGEALTLDDNLFAGLRLDARATVAAGPLARFDMPGLLRQLDRYPYGCTEQITSAALPLLYAGDLATGAGLDSIGTRINVTPQGAGRSVIRVADAFTSA